MRTTKFVYSRCWLRGQQKRNRLIDWTVGPSRTIILIGQTAAPVKLQPYLPRGVLGEEVSEGTSPQKNILW